jgi:RNA-directed DNA polymerase
MQRRLDKAVRDQELDRIRHLTYLLSRRSQAVKIVAIDRVTRINEGKHTAGVDGVKTPRDRKEADEFRKQLLTRVNIRKRPSPIRRVLISKADAKKRPLGIPTIMDRVGQDIIRMSIEPIAEYYFLDCSYGFRPKRCCQDAIEHIFTKLANRRCPQWIVEGDIKGCFDNISQEHIINTMIEWEIPKPIRTIVRRMLKAKILTETGYSESLNGTPQGGILSPMLANIALTALDQWGESQKGSNPIVRYCDDFIVTARTETDARRMTQEIHTLLKEKVGVELALEKTRITNVHDGINFLGFNIRKYRQRSPKNKFHSVGKLLIKPQQERVTRFLRNCAELIRRQRGKRFPQLLLVLNPR